MLLYGHEMNQLEPHQARKVLFFNSIITFLGFLDTHLLIPVMALYATELGASVSVVGLIIGLYSVTNTPANILAGRLIDKTGYKVPLIAGLIGDALSMFLYSMSRAPVHLALVRTFHGITGGLVAPATMSITADYSTAARKGKAMSFYGMAIGAATLAGYGLSGVITSRFGYRALFLFGTMMLVAGVIMGLLIPGRRGVAAETPHSGGFKNAGKLLRRRGLTAAYCSIFAQYFTFGGVVTLLPLYIKSLGMDAFHIGMLMASFAIMFVIMQFPSGILSDRVGRRTPVVIGLSLGIISLVLLPSMRAFPLLIMAMALYGIAYGILFPSISALVADHTLPEERGMATGIFHALLTAGVAIGAPVMGWAAGIIGIGPGLASTSGIMVVALVVALAVIDK